MTDVMLTWLSFIIWLILTTLLFIALARWSAGEGAWGGMSAIVRGLHDWAAPREPARAVSSPASPVSSPASAVSPPASAVSSPASVATAEPVAEIEEL